MLRFSHKLKFLYTFFLISLAFLWVVQTSNGQDEVFLRVVEPFPILDPTGSDYSLPFLGGLNRPALQYVDIDDDQDLDLFIRDKRDRLIFLENVGSSSVAAFEWVTDDYGDLDVGGWFKFLDADNDGDQDLLADNNSSYIRYFRNDGTAANAIFVLGADTLKDIANESVFVEIPTIPDWADIDCDGDADMFLGRLSGAITHYEHQGVTGNLPSFSFVTDSFQDLLILTGSDNCQTARAGRDSDALHGANSMTFVDIDDDLDNDLFWGDFFAPSLLFLENSGTCEVPTMDTTVEHYPAVDPVCTGGFNIPSFGDIDDDGDYDLFIGVQGGAYSLTSDLADNLYFYENTGNAQQPVYELRSARYLNSVDIGDKSIPAMADIDGDGDLDVLLGNEAEPSADISSRLHYFENQGSSGSPVLSHVDENYLSLEIGYNYAPAFVDIDNDGDEDVLMGEWVGNLNLLRNDGTPLNPDFILVDEDVGGIDIGNNSTPALVDIDGDMDFDLFIGEFLGTINFYRNTGTPESYVFELDTTNYFGIDVGSYSAPQFVDVDHDGDFDLFVGSEDEGIQFFRNGGTPQEAAFVPDASITLPAHVRGALVFGDIDGDSDKDILAGVDGGGMVFYENLEIAVSVEEAASPLGPTLLGLVRSFPNPFNPSTTIEFELARSADVRIEIYDATGRQVLVLTDRQYPRGFHQVEWNAEAVATGAYFSVVRAGGYTRILKLLLTR